GTRRAGPGGEGGRSGPGARGGTGPGGRGGTDRRPAGPRGGSQGAEGEEADEQPAQDLPLLKEGEDVRCLEAVSDARETKPPPRYGEAALLAAMEGAGKLIVDDELRDAMKDSGIGTPATRAAIIERLIQVGYIVRDGRRLL